MTGRVALVAAIALTLSTVIVPAQERGGGGRGGGRGGDNNNAGMAWETLRGTVMNQWQGKAPTEQPAEPFKIFDNIYYVGLQTVGAYLITTSDGLVLLDATYPETADYVLDSIRKVGFDPKNVKYL